MNGLSLSLSINRSLQRAEGNSRDWRLGIKDQHRDHLLHSLSLFLDWNKKSSVCSGGSASRESSLAAGHYSHEGDRRLSSAERARLRREPARLTPAQTLAFLLLLLPPLENVRRKKRQSGTRDCGWRWRCTGSARASRWTRASTCGTPPSRWRRWSGSTTSAPSPAR